MDNDLPDVDGVAMQDWLRLQPRLSAVPIAAYDARDVQAAEDERRAVGAVSQLLRKGQVTPEEFQWRVMTLLARPRTPPPDPEIQP
jgi:CheY-like chemotaxis protein